MPIRRVLPRCLPDDHYIPVHSRGNIVDTDHHLRIETSRQRRGILMTQEEFRLSESGTRKRHWKRWGPYLSERAWGTVREDYSANGDAWEYLPHDHARSRAYRWNEDGLAGISDRRQMMCFALAVWKEREPIIKDRIL